MSMKNTGIINNFPVVCVGGSAGGITIAQKLDTAAQPDMPESAIASGYIDIILSPEDVAREILRITHASSRAG
jgi:two-component system chemotaxis response regulator CheB